MRSPIRTILAASAAVALAAAAITAPVAAGPNKKGTTTIAPSGITLSVFQKVLKPGKLNTADTTLSFRIVGNPKKEGKPIKHVGGVQVNGEAGILNDDDLKLRNFRIKVSEGIVAGQVEGFGRAPLFSFDPADAADLEVTLFFTDIASLAIVGDTSISGLEAGVASIDLK
jgi:hypothetical protein